MNEYLLLFITAFASATVIPGFSEAGVAAMIATSHPAGLVVVVATVGNTLGSVVNWWLGKSMLHFADRRWFPANAAQLERAGRWFARYGHWCLLFAWAPVVGDLITLIAGVFRVRLLWFLFLVGLGKALRYTLVAALTEAVIAR